MVGKKKFCVSARRILVIHCSTLDWKPSAVLTNTLTRLYRSHIGSEMMSTFQTENLLSSQNSCDDTPRDFTVSWSFPLCPIVLTVMIVLCNCLTEVAAVRLVSGIRCHTALNESATISVDERKRGAGFDYCP